VAKQLIITSLSGTEEMLAELDSMNFQPESKKGLKR